MKWERVKETVAREVYTAILEGRGVVPLEVNPYTAQIAACFDAIAEKRTFRESLQALADEAFNIVMNWDVRCAEKLRAIQPAYFPKSLRNGKLFADYDDSGDWAIWSE